MVIALALFSVLFTGLSLYGLVLPRGLTRFVRRFMLGPGVWGAVVIRLLLAALLWFSAPVSHTPTTFQVLAVLLLLSAVALPIIGAARLIEIIDRFASWPPIVLRLQCMIGVAVGGFLLWSVSAELGFAYAAGHGLAAPSP